MPPIRGYLVFALRGAIMWGSRRSFWRSLRQFPGGKDGGTSGLVPGTGRRGNSSLLEWEHLDGPSTAGSGGCSARRTALSGRSSRPDGRIRTAVRDHHDVNRSDPDAAVSPSRCSCPRAHPGGRSAARGSADRRPTLVRTSAFAARTEFARPHCPWARSFGGDCSSRRSPKGSGSSRNTRYRLAGGAGQCGRTQPQGGR